MAKPLSADELRGLLAEHGGWAAAARATGLSLSAIYSRASALGIRADESEPDGSAPVQESRPRQVIETGRESASAEFVEATVDPADVPTDDELLKRANLDPKDWEVVSRRQSVWDAMGPDGVDRTMRSLRVSYGRVRESLSDVVLPAFGGKPVSVRSPRRLKRTMRESELIFVLSDFHAPFFDERLLAATEQVMLSEQPDRVIINGDLVDWPTVSRHAKKTQDHWVSANDCIQSAGKVLARIRAAVPEDCRIQFLPGNHDANLSRFLLDRAEAAADLCVSGSDVPVWSLRNLLRFDELGIEQIGQEDRWEQATIKLTDELVVRHGLSVRAGSAASVIANLKSATFASITGHTHRQGVAGVTRNRPKGHKILLGAEIGGMFQMPRKPTDWPTYVAHDRLDWQPGWASISLEKDKHYCLDLASWQNGALMWRGSRYSHKED